MSLEGARVCHCLRIEIQPVTSLGILSAEVADILTKLIAMDIVPIP